MERLEEIAEFTDEITITWGIEDVRQIAPDTTLKQAGMVLDFLHDNHDANEGISWSTIEAAVEYLSQQKDWTSF